MAFIQLTKLKDKSPILFNVEYIESIEPEHINWKHSTTRIHYRESFYDVSESFAQVTSLIRKITMVGIINLEGEANVTKVNGTYTRDGRLMHDLVYRGEAEETDTDSISRQAAIEEIKNATTITGWNKYASQEEIVDDVERQLRRLFVGAIESLPPVEPKPVLEDAISRRDLSDKVGRYYEERGDFGSFECFWILDAIRNAPPVEPERPKGEWVGEGDGYADGGIVYDTWYCSKCDHCEEGEELALPNFCPNCGARMKGEEK